MAKEEKVCECGCESCERDTRETVSKADYDAVVAENVKLRSAVDKLVTALTQRYAQDIYKEVLAD